MGLIRKPQVRVVYAEVGTPPDGTTNPIEHDLFSDINASTLAGADLITALATLGLSYAAGTFTALSAVVLQFTIQLDINASPGGACTVYLTASAGYLSDQEIAVANPNTLGTLFLHRTMALPAGATFKLRQTCANGTDVPLDYAAMSIIRLI